VGGVPEPPLECPGSVPPLDPSAVRRASSGSRRPSRSTAPAAERRASSGSLRAPLLPRLATVPSRPPSSVPARRCLRPSWAKTSPLPS
jgi:hypothetical protein